MAFNLQAFGAGFAKKVTADLDDTRDRMNRLADQETSIATQQRLSKQAKREEEQEIADNLVESLSLYYTPEQIADIVPRGKNAVSYAMGRANYYEGKGIDASTMYTLTNNDIANMDTSNTTRIGDVSETADVPEGMGSAPFASNFKTIKPTKKDKTLAAFQLSLLQERIDAGTDPELIAKVDEKEKQFFEQTSKLEDAKRETKDTKERYTNSERLNLITKAQKLHRNALELSVGIKGQLLGEYKGSNKLALAELNAASYLYTQNTNVLQEETLFKEIVGLAENAKVMLNNYAKKSSTIYDVKAKYTYSSAGELQAAARANSIPVGQNYIVNTTIPDGTTRYAVGTYVGDSYKNIGVGYTMVEGELKYRPFLTASYLNKGFKPNVENEDTKN